MKRISALIIALIMLLSASACAEGPAFRLENGLYWGMTQEEIFALLGEENAGLIEMFDGVDMIQYVLDTDIPDDDCDVWLSMALVDGKLALIMYDLLRVDDPAVKEGCVADLTALYGKPYQGGLDRFMASLGMLDGRNDMTAAEIGAPGAGCSWELTDGTFMGVFDLTDISFGVYFVDEPNFARVIEYYDAADIASVELSPLLYDSFVEYLEEMELSRTIPAIMHSGFDEIYSSVKATGSEVTVINGAPDGPDVIMFTEEYGSSEVATSLMFGGDGLRVVAFGIEDGRYENAALALKIGEALAAEFGAPAPVNEAGFYVINMLTYGAYESSDPASISCWTLEGGTLAVLAPVPEGDFSGADIYFISEKMFE